MLGSFRFFLAICVVFFHLTAQIPNLGQFSVECFYVISGYLITLILNETYRFEFKTFTLNRFMRLYPSYYALTLVTLCMWLAMPRMAEFHQCWVWAGRASDVIGNALIWPWAFWTDQPGAARFRLIPSTWSVAVEIVCYAILWLFAARRWWTSVLAAVASIGWHLYVTQKGLDPGQRYSPVAAALLAFCVGSLTYRLADWATARRPSWSRATAAQPLLLALAIIAFVLVWRASRFDGTATSNPYFYGIMLVAAGAVLLFHRIRTAGAIGWIDRWLGDLSYPVFMFHYPAGYLAWLALGQPEAMRGWSIAWLAVPIALAASVLVVKLVDHPLRSSRDVVRQRAIGRNS